MDCISERCMDKRPGQHACAETAITENGKFQTCPKLENYKKTALNPILQWYESLVVNQC